jgi:GTPase SAR1 family protein
MVRKIIVIMGLPGSGKTYLANTFRKWNSKTIDDFNVKVQNNPLLTWAIIRFSFWINRLIITDVVAITSTRENITSVLKERFGKFVEVEFIAFENNAAAAWTNVKRRNDGRKISQEFIREMSKRYRPEKFTDDIRPIYREKK